ncbi:MAG: hypothetical protein EX269_14665, partial [Acidimicrobiales bacterium]
MIEHPVALPGAEETALCADFARENRIDPGGTALAPDVIVLIEVPEPWPKPVAKHEDLVELVSLAVSHSEQVRLLAAVPHDVDAPRAIAFRPAPGGAVRSEMPLGDQPAAALRAVLHAKTGEFAPVGDSHRTILVCTQGSHDVCCGTLGEAAAAAYETEFDAEVFRVSHTGGHRFAPTAMTLPDGRMWAYLTTDDMAKILGRQSASELASSSRGWWGAPTGPAQVAERAVFAQQGFVFDEEPRSVAVVEDDDGTHVATVATADRCWRVRVAVGREVPTIACNKP